MIKSIIIILLIAFSSLSAEKYDYHKIRGYYMKHLLSIEKYSNIFGLPKKLIVAIPSARENKLWDPSIVVVQDSNDVYCYVGLFQLQEYRKKKKEIKRLQNPDYNMQKACKKLRRYINKFKIGNCDTDDDILWGLMAYQLGPTGARRYFKKHGDFSKYAYDIFTCWKLLEVNLYIK